MTTKMVSLGEFLTDDEIKTVINMYHNGDRAPEFRTVIIDPVIKRINKALGQENDPMYLAYMIEYACSIAGH